MEFCDNMDNKMIIKVATILIFVFVTPVFAAPANTPGAVPKNLHVYDVGGNTYVDHIPAGCAVSRYILSPGHFKYDTIISILMAAQIANKEVVLRYDGCDGNSMGKIVGVYLK